MSCLQCLLRTGLDEDVLVHALLPLGQTALENVLILLRHLLFYISLGTAQDEGLNHPVQPDDQLVAVVLVLIGAGFDGEVEVWVCYSWQEEVDHCP